MKLFEHADFEQAILGRRNISSAQGLRPAIIEKDYYVTEALRIIAAAAPDKVIFKGGTSLAERLEPHRSGFRKTSISSSIPSPSSPPRKERHRPGTQKAPRRRRRPSRPDVRRSGEPDHRRIRAQRPLLLHATLRRPRRSRQPRPARSRHRQRPRAHHRRRAALLSRTVPERNKNHTRRRR